MPIRRLTKPQRDELKRMLKEPQNTWGKFRARVQNCLVDKGLAEFQDDNGNKTRRYEFVAGRMVDNLKASRCAITDAGRIEVGREA